MFHIILYNPEIPPNTGNIIENGETGLIFGEGKCADYLGKSLYNLQSDSKRRYNNNGKIENNIDKIDTTYTLS